MYTVLTYIPVLDSWGKPPPRIFVGNSKWTGAYDECKKVKNAKFCYCNMKIGGVVSLYYRSNHSNCCFDSYYNLLLLKCQTTVCENRPFEKKCVCLILCYL